MGADKTAGLRPTEELGCLGGWETFCLAGLNIVILLSQQSSAFDGTCQVPSGPGGRSSPLIRQLSAPQSPESLRLLQRVVGDFKAGEPCEVSADFENN